jgi:hypothetical protein
MNSRREFLRLTAVTATASLGGCIRGIADQVSSGIAWPPSRPPDVSDQDEIPDLPPPTWGESNAPRLLIYNDLATHEAGEIFHKKWNSLHQLAKEDYLQVSFYDYPLPWSEWSLPVAISARSVQHHAGIDSFVIFLRHILRNFTPQPHFTKEKILDAAEASGAPRSVVESDTEAWRFYPVVRGNKKRGKQMGLNDSVPLAVIVDDGQHTRPFQPTIDRIEIMVNSLDQ